MSKMKSHKTAIDEIREMCENFRVTDQDNGRDALRKIRHKINIQLDWR